MKKITIVFMVLFISILTTFSQTFVNGTTFRLFVDGSPDDFYVTWNPDSYYLLFVFVHPISSLSIPPTEALRFPETEHTYIDIENQEGIIMTKIHYYPGTGFQSGYLVELHATPYLSSSFWPTFTYNDTVDIFNNGVNSVVCDPNAGYEEGFTAGVNSVDTLLFYNNGVNSVDTQSFYDNGFDDGFIDGVNSVDTLLFYNNGVNSVDTQSFYDNGFTMGVNSVVCVWEEQDTINAYNNGLIIGADFSVNADDYQAGFVAGKTTCGTTGVGMTAFNMGVNVYPNPVNSGVDITIDCPFFESVTVLTIRGQVIESYNIPTVPTSNLTSGMYFLNIKDVDGNVSATKVIIK